MEMLLINYLVSLTETVLTYVSFANIAHFSQVLVIFGQQLPKLTNIFMEELKQYKWLLIVFLLFVVSAFSSCKELKYKTSGETVDARISDIYKTTSSRRRFMKSTKLKVNYVFYDEEGYPHSESDTVATDWPFKGKNVKVEYLVGEKGSSRLVGNSETMMVWIFFTTFGILAFTGFRFYRQLV